ncbi:plasma-membrane choline transporter-domain-containing protein [Gamsiella multidivaricata]|uniref:plasma-membrane choline transporter-domain-containing protein n=1 Tax=Gamsiella multidivaricata TaxID=101098 RepID=UPI00221ECEB6|nr:plasma-membrane choline transporter-domain-containing protein [Gamsiella multidivaricata]KAG0370328.1 putative choline transporter, neither null mutation nor overexpression affects choline transport [Gamsiella multidivaricata]KAI7824753.1 plasma-membrane choline transporter-domain-containing protein [Gamsiella multidivaricata]
MAHYAPQQPQPYGPPPPIHQPQYAYNPQQQPMYDPDAQHRQWGQNQSAQEQYFAPPTGPTQGQPLTGVAPPSYESAPYGSVNPESGLPTKFNPRPRYNDCWAFLLFIAQLAAFVVLSYYAIHQVVQDRQYGNNGYYQQPGGGTSQSGRTFGFFSRSGLITMLISILTGAVVAVLYFILTQAFPRQVIKVTFALSIIVYLAVAVYYFVRRQWMPAIFGLIFGLLYASMWFFWQSRIPFATEMLRAVTSISKAYPATFAMAFLGLIVQSAYSVYFITTIAGCYEMYYDTNTRTTPGKLKALIVFCFFSFYWTSQVIKNIVHVTISGVFACYYFLMGSPQGMSKSPTLESFKRACTTSIGSICFGSLIIAAIQTLRALAQMLRGDGSDGIMAFLACIIDCILGCLQGIVDYVNKYAFCQVAIYGKSYIPAARDTWNILKDRGIVQIINDNLIGNVWAMGAIMSGMLSALASYLYLRFEKPPFNANNEFTYVIVTMAFVMGLQMLFTVGSVIDSGVATTFVCLAEDPAALARTKPELFERIRMTWPAVVQGVNY